MAYRQVYFRIRTDCYNSGWTSDADRTAFEKESRRLFQELGWTATLGYNGGCDTVTMGQQDLYLHPSSFSGVIDEASIQPLQEQLSKARTFRCYHVDRASASHSAHHIIARRTLEMWGFTRIGPQYPQSTIRLTGSAAEEAVPLAALDQWLKFRYIN
ncbi:hypothetical protein [Oscillibacter sp. 1-3]|uniref:hypothetical protein n=1 Tax=Oscillibacter sp. 1-3 TaxID=1235797 RepID=UPI0003349471|nr:hypothetical protein [Oscillibacter sp. 1-3]EOS67211.1 hypothetical protein C816_00560 [Oscillibacter sp. 1-3]